MLRTPNAVLVALALAGGGVLAGCEPEVPANPTWVDDVHPILLARCERCHLARGTKVSREGVTSLVNRDDLIHPYSPPDGPETSFDYATLAEIQSDPLGSPLGLWMGTMSLLVHNSGTPDGMPPLPATKLDGWQIDTIDRWIKNPK